MGSDPCEVLYQTSELLYSLYLNDCVVDGLKSYTKDKLLDQSGSKIIYPQVYGTE